MAEKNAAAVRAQKNRKKVTPGSIVSKVIIVLICVIDIYPIIWMLTASLKQSYEWSAKPAYALPDGFYFQNYIDAWNRGHMSTFFFNSVVDTMVYLGDCARFDRVAAEAVRVHAGSPSSAEYGVVDNAAEVRGEIEAAMPSSGHLSYAVTSQGALSAGVSGYGSILSFIPQPQVYTCALVFSPWPFSHGAFGAHPLQITHRKSFAVDPYRPGVIM